MSSRHMLIKNIYVFFFLNSILLNDYLQFSFLLSYFISSQRAKVDTNTLKNNLNVYVLDNNNVTRFVILFDKFTCISS